MRVTRPDAGGCRQRMVYRNCQWCSASAMPQLIDHLTSQCIVPVKPCSNAMGVRMGMRVARGLDVLGQLWCVQHLVHAP